MNLGFDNTNLHTVDVFLVVQVMVGVKLYYVRIGLTMEAVQRELQLQSVASSCHRQRWSGHCAAHE